MKKRGIKSKFICAALSAALVSSALVLSPWSVMGEGVAAELNGASELEASSKIESGDDLVPMRAVFEKLGMEVSWNGGNNTVTAVKNGKSVTATVGSGSVIVNGAVLEVSAPPVNENGRVLIPLSVVSAVFGADVAWDGENAAVTKVKEESDDSWKNNTGTVNLSSMTVSGDGLGVNGKIIEITKGGDYTLSGTASDAMVRVNADESVKLRLNGVNLTNTDGPAIFFEKCEKSFITISKGTENLLSDGENYTADAKGAVFSNSDLEIKGGGSLAVTGNYNHGICSDDKLEIEEGSISVKAKNDALHANDAVEISGGAVNIEAEGDAIQSEGYVEISGGTINITTTGEITDTFSTQRGAFGGFGGGMAGGFGGFNTGEAGSAENRPSRGNAQIMTYGNMPNGNPPERQDANTPNGNPPETAGGNTPKGTPPGLIDEYTQNQDEESGGSSKGIKAETNLIVTGGEINVSSTDHCMHTAGIAFISGGSMKLSSQKKKGISAHAQLIIEDGIINIEKSTEGIESKGPLCINGGEIYVTASDDGLNAGGTELAGFPLEDYAGHTILTHLHGDGNLRNEIEQDAGSQSDEHSLYINGGKVIIDAGGDGVDANGNIYFNGGTVIVNGPVSNGNGALDSGGKIVETGGVLIASGSSGMAEAPRGDGCTQPSLNCNFTAGQAAGAIIRIEDSGGGEILTFKPSKSFQSIVYSSAALEIGEEYTIYVGGSYEGGENTDGVLTGGTYTPPESEPQKIKLESMSASAGASMSGFGGFGGGTGGFGGGTGKRGM